MNPGNSTTLSLSWILVLGFPFVFIWQGIDITDTGFFLYSYENFFKYADNPLISSWLTGYIGYLNSITLGFIGLLGYRLFFIPIIWLSSILVFSIIRDAFPSLNRNLILLSILIAYSTIGWNVGIITYSNLSAAFLLSSGTLIYFGLTRSQTIYLCISGFLIGISIFIRFPNVLFYLMIIVIITYNLMCKSRYKIMYTQIGLFILGSALGIILIVYLIYKQGHWEIYLENILSLFQNSNEKGSIHSINRMILKYLKDYSAALISASFVIAGIVISSKLSKWVNRNVISLIIGVIALIVLHVFWRYILLGLFLLSIGFIFLKSFKNDSKKMILSLLIILLLILPSLGSNTGIGNTIHAYWLAVPFLFAQLSEMQDSTFFKYRIPKHALKYYLKLSCVILGCFSLFQVTTFTYRDSQKRFAMRYPLEHPKLSSILTTKDRARVLNEVVTEIDKYINPGDTLFAYPVMPMLHYLTETYPFLGNPWPEGLTISEIGFKLTLAANQNILPPIIKAKGSTQDPHWPKTPIPDNRIGYLDKWLLFRDFESKNNYSIVWENDFFEILLPS